MFTFDKEKLIKGVESMTDKDVTKYILIIHNDEYLLEDDIDIDRDIEENRDAKITYYKFIRLHWNGYCRGLFSNEPFVAVEVMNLHQFNALAIAPFLVSNKIIYMPARDIGRFYGDVLCRKKRQMIIDNAYKEMVAEIVFMELLYKGELNDVVQIDDNDTEFTIKVKDLYEAVKRNKELVEEVKKFVINLIKQGDEKKARHRYKILMDTLKAKDINDMFTLVDETKDEFEEYFINNCIDIRRSWEQKDI